jgi:transposase
VKVEHSAHGLTKDRRFYGANFKLTVLQRLRSERLPCRRAAALFNIRRHDMIGSWQRAYEIGGVAALYPHSGARLIAMAKQSTVKSGAEKVPDEMRTRK